ncbi:MAG: DNA polymerase III subunit beta [Candidatus Ancillula sp.]|jgi:DNA polymerase-3 subunit beta|nr:DNA polymerase III subunit beta [Candidatus Ancillula sp.]
MKLKIKKDVLLDSINWVSRVIVARPVLPILSNVLLVAKDTSLTLSASNIEVSSKSEKLANIEKPGEVIVQGRLFAEVVKALPNKDITLELKGSKLVVESENLHYSISCAPKDSYPDSTQMPKVLGSVETDLLLRSVQQVSVAAAKEENTPILTAIKVEIDNENITFSAIDRYRIAKKIVAWKPKSKISSTITLLIKSKNLLEIIRGFESGGTVNIHFEEKNPNRVGFGADDKTSILQLISGDFPQTEQLFKDKYIEEIIIEKDVFQEAINSVSILTDQNVSIIFNIQKNVIKLSSQGNEEFNAENQIPCQYTGKDIAIKFNSAYIKEGIAQFKSRYIIMKFDESTKPVEIVGADKPDGELDIEYRYVIVPIRVT